ncbi:hypothetical protein CDL15_Pgr028393 [Punica granatum]|uniref:Uncharacterized protein n=1 Tax=Punica granatum TaxID=22663 RepID=A0A218W5G4_PUNGR|nr:hypothetical protein CDL15_Pgr028393 [Punica granatum]
MVVDAVAALSCEAIKADVSAFNSVDSGDGFTPKDEIGVSSEMKVLLNGSKLVVGKAGSRKDGAVVAGATALLPLASALQSVVILDTHYGRDYDNFVHEVYVLSGSVWKIVAWEAVSAFVALEGAKLTGKETEGDVTGGNAQVDKKIEKKKKKVVLGKGTAVVVQVINDRLQRIGGNASDIVEKFVEDLLLFFDTKDQHFDVLLKTLKDILESNESRRLPKLPKTLSLSHMGWS